MRLKISLFFLLPFILISNVFVRPVFSGSAAADYLCEFGITFYKSGRYDDALLEFNKVLLLDPANVTAKEYIDKIIQKEFPGVTSEEIKKRPTREEAMDDTFSGLLKKEKPEEKKEFVAPGPNISGEIQLRLGITENDLYWKRANWDLNEKNWRILSSEALNRRENTYDPRVYDRIMINVDSGSEENLGYHANISVDPWSYPGKSQKITLTEPALGDYTELELKSLYNTGYTLNETIYSLKNGDTIALPEMKVYNGYVHANTLTSAFGGIYTLPELKIQYEFWPIREFWLDYKQDNLKLRVYPIAYENQALTFDDPLRLSNNRIWWESSPWLNSWQSGIFNYGATPQDFTKGYWNKTNAFGIRDSEGQRLTALRGISLELNPKQQTSFVAGVAAPKDLWQEYSEVDNFIFVSRLKHSLTNSLCLGISLTSRLGYNIDDGKQDTQNYVTATDLGYEIINGVKTDFEFAHSQSKYDITDSQYKTKMGGSAYHFSVIGKFPQESIMNIEYGYNGIQPSEEELFFTKFKIYAVRMDDSFDQPLSSYVETRDDESWGRHIHFRKPFKYYYQGESQLLTWDDVKVYKIGDGIDVGRSVLGLRIESLLWNGKIDNLFDVRNVHDTDNGKFLENVARDELTWKATDKLTAKLLGIYQEMPKTNGGIDPFIFDTRTREYFANTYIPDGADPSLETGSVGMEYEFFNWFALNGIWERTNDYSLAYDNFPRSMFNSADNSYIYYEEGNKYRDLNNWLYNQQFFPLPPYPYYDIFKIGLRFTPIEALDIYLDYTRNEYEKAGQVDDNMNHVGFEIAYNPNRKFGLFLKYTYSRWQDLDCLLNGVTEPLGHHNFFAEFIYRKSDNEDFTFQYGEASRNPYMGGVLDIGWDPYGGSLRTIDTQHIFRLFYRRKF